MLTFFFVPFIPRKQTYKNKNALFLPNTVLSGPWGLQRTNVQYYIAQIFHIYLL